MFTLTMEFSTIEELLVAANSIAGTSQSMTIDPPIPIVTPPIIDNCLSVETLPNVQEVIATNNQAAPEVDAEGTSWDDRIHAGTKTMSAKGIWKKKRGVESPVFDAIMAELQGVGINHSQLLDRIISEFAEGNLSVFTVGDVVTELGISSLNDASGNPEMIETIAERLGVE